jgi:hypothetical protein
MLNCLQERDPVVCIKLSLNFFQEMFSDKIEILQRQFPRNHILFNDQPFWNNFRKYPITIDFDLHDPLHLSLVISAANIYAAIFGLPFFTDSNAVIQLIRKVK